MPKHTLKPSKESDLAAKIRESLGIGPDEPVDVVTPQFEREPHDPAPSGCPDRQTLERLSQTPTRELREWGLRPWGTINGLPDTTWLWLFPGEWYKDLPAGLPIVTINGAERTFEPGKTDDDIRYGCLAYGVLAKHEPCDGFKEGE